MGFLEWLNEPGGLNFVVAPVIRVVDSILEVEVDEQRAVAFYGHEVVSRVKEPCEDTSPIPLDMHQRVDLIDDLDKPFKVKVPDKVVTKVQFIRVDEAGNEITERINKRSKASDTRKAQRSAKAKATANKKKAKKARKRSK
jgi:hypothetical protein